MTVVPSFLVNRERDEGNTSKDALYLPTYISSHQENYTECSRFIIYPVSEKKIQYNYIKIHKVQYEHTVQFLFRFKGSNRKFLG